MNTETLIHELESRGHQVVRCRHNKCGKPATEQRGKKPVCTTCGTKIDRADRRKTYGCVATLMPANERIMAERYRRTIEGQSSKEIETWLLDETGYSLEDWSRIEDYVHAGRKCHTWLVWGTSKGRLMTYRDREMVVLARSGAEARKVWREYLYKHGVRNLPDHCEARCLDGRPELQPQVVSTSVEMGLEISMDLED